MAFIFGISDSKEAADQKDFRNSSSFSSQLIVISYSSMMDFLILQSGAGRTYATHIELFSVVKLPTMYGSGLPHRSSSVFLVAVFSSIFEGLWHVAEGKHSSRRNLLSSSVFDCIKDGIDDMPVPRAPAEYPTYSLQDLAFGWAGIAS